MQNRKTIYIPIFSPAVAGKAFSLKGQNPGCGGTQFASIKLAFFLAKANPDYDLVLINPETIHLVSPPDNLHLSAANSFDEFLAGHVFEELDYALIIPMAILRQTDSNLIYEHLKRTIIWLHHPFNYDLSFRSLGLAAYVCVGTYQFFTNNSFYSPLWHIQNIFQLPDAKNAHSPFLKNDHVSAVKLVYLGALIPAKGFLDIAKQWPRIKTTYPDAELHVIGSSATYGREPGNQLVPADSSFADQILQYIPQEDIESGKVIFYGNLGGEKFDVLSTCHAALLNPRGLSEAFPASPLECMSVGLPVIASDDFGMSDSMRFFPELCLKRPEQIPQKINFLFSDVHRYDELRERALAVAKWFELQNGQIVARWHRLIEKVCSSNANIQDEGPILSLYGSRLRLMKRKIRAFLSAIKRYVKNTK